MDFSHFYSFVFNLSVTSNELELSEKFSNSSVRKSQRESILEPVTFVDEKRDTEDQPNDTKELIFVVVVDRTKVPMCVERLLNEERSHVQIVDVLLVVDKLKRPSNFHFDFVDV